MKKSLFLLIMACGSALLHAQTKPTVNTVDFELGNGLTLNANDGLYQLQIQGTIQPYFGYRDLGNEVSENYFNVARSYLSFGGFAVDEKFSFFVQLDFSSPSPLLDAWGAYEPWKDVKFIVGQKQNIANNREMLYMENQLQFVNRSLLSTTFSASGREMGLFFDSKFGNSFVIAPQLAVTSGDGRNSFGMDSRDIDVGGFKYAARLDVYPLGDFSEGNNIGVADFAREEQLKMVLGGAYSYNYGASNAVGEGHDDFNLYDNLGNELYPDYRKLYADVLLKYKGFSLLGEYAVATATSLDGMYTTVTSDPLLPTQISEYLNLGSSYNVQLGYVTPWDYALDIRYSQVNQEFETNANSLVRDATAYSIGVSKYFKNNALKVHGAFTTIEQEGSSRVLLAELMLQVMI